MNKYFLITLCLLLSISSCKKDTPPIINIPQGGDASAVYNLTKVASGVRGKFLELAPKQVVTLN